MERVLSSTIYLNRKPRYELLDGLRGVAAFLVLWYHIFEGFATSPMDQNFNHGYLAVDFFFILSGFVIGYAYDDRWKKGMSAGEFFTRRVIRLHPMVILGVVIGVTAFALVGFEKWDGTHATLAMVVLAALFNLFLLPIVPGWDCDVRGNGEMFPLNGPNWSLFFEYVGCLIYAFFVRRLSTRNLKLLVAISGAGLVAYAVGNMSGACHMGVGWTLGDYNLLGGLLRIVFSFSMGLLMSRGFRPWKVRGAFWVCGLALVVLLAMPYAGTAERMWTNGLYDGICIVFLFPLILKIGASGKTTDVFSSNLCEFMGNISYPLYVIHYPSMYIFYRWVWNNHFTFGESWHVAVMIIAGNIIMAWVFLKIYDEPIRKRLAARFLAKNKPDA